MKDEIKLVLSAGMLGLMLGGGMIGTIFNLWLGHMHSHRAAIIQHQQEQMEMVQHLLSVPSVPVDDRCYSCEG